MINMAGYDNLAIFGAVVVGLLWFQPCTTVLFCKRYDIFSYVTSSRVIAVCKGKVYDGILACV